MFESLHHQDLSQARVGLVLLGRDFSSSATLGGGLFGTQFKSVFAFSTALQWMICNLLLPTCSNVSFTLIYSSFF